MSLNKGAESTENDKEFSKRSKSITAPQECVRHVEFLLDATPTKKITQITFNSTSTVGAPNADKPLKPSPAQLQMHMTTQPRIDRAAERRTAGEARTASPGARRPAPTSFSGERDQLIASSRRIQGRIEMEKSNVQRKIVNWQKGLNHNVRPRTTSYIQRSIMRSNQDH